MDQAFMTDVIGYVAAVIGTVLMLPQVVKSLRTTSARDISGLMLAAYLTQCLLWGVYGFLIEATPLIVCNTIAFCIGAFQVLLKITYAED